jgi:outer membrane protein assembly factor BamB
VLSGQPVLHDETLYVLTRGGTVFALDPADGSEGWRHQLDGTSEAGGATLVANTETLVVPLESHSQERGLRRALVGLATVDGHARWRTGGIQTAPVSDESTVYGAEFGDVGGSSTVFALSAADGSERWRFTKPGRPKTWSSLSAVHGTVFASFTERTGGGDVKDDDSTLYAVDADGTEQWRFTRSCEGFSRVVVSGGTAYAASRYGDSTLYALASET